LCGRPISRDDSRRKTGILTPRFFVIDFETYYGPNYTLAALGNSDYIMGANFEVMCVGVKESADPARIFTPKAFLEWATTVNWDCATVVAHNAHFDAGILAFRYGVYPRQVLCTLAMARALSCPTGHSLDAISQHFGLGEKGGEELDAVRGKHLKDCSEAELAALHKYCLQDCELTSLAFERLAPEFSISQLRAIAMTVELYTRPLMALDEVGLVKHRDDELVRKDAYLQKVGATRTQMRSKPQFAQLLTTAGAVIPMKPSKADPTKLDFAFAKNDVGMQGLLESPDDEIRFLAEARVANNSSLSETRAQRFIDDTKYFGGKAPVYIQYGKAHTQRFAGGDKRNRQNMPRGGELRKAHRAPSGKVLVVCDASQVEARFLAWFSRGKEMLARFRAGQDVYCALASEVFGREINDKLRPEDKRPRMLGKAMMLGLGYMQGHVRFGVELYKGPFGMPSMLFGTDMYDFFGATDSFTQWEEERMSQVITRVPEREMRVHFAVSKFLVNRFRAINDYAPRAWKECDKAIVAMAEGSRYNLFQHGFVTEYHAIKRPSGLKLQYHELRRANGNRRGWEYKPDAYKPNRGNLYGGLLTENVTQSGCGDIHVEHATRLKFEEKIDVALLAHDEIVAVANANEASAVAEKMLEVMGQAPAWCRDLPISAGCKIGDNYCELEELK
jgi:DNA polymerase family A/3'-5' exonuclease